MSSGARDTRIVHVYQMQRSTTLSFGSTEHEHEDGVVDSKAEPSTCSTELRKERTSIPLFKSITHMYRLKDINVILPKLYLTTINRGTMTCIKDAFWARVNYIALPTKLCTSFTFTLLTLKPKVYL
jgi:hypothetical protein